MWLKCSALFLFALFVNNAAGNCEIDDPGWEHADLTFDFDVNDKEGTSKEYKIKNIEAIEMDQTYLTYDINKDILKFSLTKEFEQYAEKEKDSVYTMKMKLTCQNGDVQNAALNLQVLDPVNRKPEFTINPYNFKLVLPITANTMIDYVKIEAKDMNLGEEKLKFTVTDSLCSQYFEFTESEQKLRIYSSTLKSKKLVQLVETVTCSVEVQDKGGLKDTTTMVLEIDTVESQPPNPIFKKPLYEATYLDNTIQMDSVELVKTDYEAKFEIFPENQREYFKFDETNKKLITTDTPLPDNAFDDKNYIAITIQATYDKAQHPGRTIVNIISNKKNDPIPTFDNLLYEVEAKKDYTIDPIEIKLEAPSSSGAVAIVEIDTEYKKYFKWNNNQFTQDIPLPDDTFDSVDYITVTIEAYFKKDKGSNKAVIIINAPEKNIPVFDKLMYQAQYEKNNEMKPVPIALAPSTTGDEAKVEIETGYQKYFKWKNNEFTLESALPDDTFDSVDYISVTIEAFYDLIEGSNKAVVIINAPVKNIPVFDKLMYQAQYEKNNEMKPVPIVLAPSTTGDEAKVEIETGYQKYFKWKNNEFTLESALPDDTFDSVDYISVTIEAFYDLTEGSNKAVVIINAPVKNIPVFDKLMYQAQYEKNNEMKPVPIVLAPSTTGDEAKVEIETSYQKYFKWKNNEFTLESALPDDTFDSVDYISVTIEAFYDLIEGSNKAVVIINAPKRDIEVSYPLFEEPMYQAQYKDNNEMDPVEIKLVHPTTDPTLKVEIETTHRDYFKWENNQFTLQKALPKGTFDSVDYITVTIEAYYNKAKGSGKTVVIINGPVKDDEEKDQIPEFQLPVYEAQYKEDNTMDPVEIKLELTTSGSAPTVEIETAYSDYFKWENNQFTLEKALPKGTFDSVDYITVTIEAYYNKAKGSGKTVVIISGPVKDDEEKDQIPEFQLPVYEAQYKEDNTMDPVEIKLELTTSGSAPTVEIETAYSDYFKWENNQFTLEKALPKGTFDSVDYITVTIEAYYNKAKGSGKTVVIISGPVKDDEEKDQIPEFQLPVYEAQYKEDNTMDSVEIKLELTTSGSAPTVEIETAYSDYFKWENNQFTLQKALPKGTFDSVDYITVTIEAYYNKAKGSGKTVVIISGPVKDDEEKDQIPEFQLPVYEAQYKEDNTMDSVEIKLELTTSGSAPTVEIETAYRDYFKWENNQFILEKALPKGTFDSVDYITVTIEAYYNKAKGSGKTVVIISGPVKDDEEKDQIPEFQLPVYEAQYKEDNTMDSVEIKLELTTSGSAPTVEIETAYRDYFKWENNQFILEKALPKGTFDSVDYITVTIEAYYNKAKGSGKTVVIISGPVKDDEEKDQIPEFQLPVYEAQYKEDNTMDPVEIKLELTTSGSAPTVEIETAYSDYFKWENNQFILEKALPKGTFDSVDYITVTIEAYYNKAKGSGKTVVIISGPVKDDEEKDQIPEFQLPVYEAQYKEDNTMDSVEIKLELTTSGSTPKVEIETAYREYFKWENDQFTLEKALPKGTFDSDNYITVTIEAYINKDKGSGKTVVIINSPEKDDDDNSDEDEIIPEFEHPFYRSQYKNDATMDPLTIKLKSPSSKARFEINPEKYEKYFILIDDKFDLKSKLPEDTFDNVNYITVTIHAFYDKSKLFGRTVVIIDSPKQAVIKPQVWYEEKLEVFDKEHTFTGLLGIYIAHSDNDEDILYKIIKTDPDIQDKLEYKPNGELIVKEKLFEITYFQITLQAEGKETKSANTMDVILIINDRINADSKFRYSLIVEEVYENSDQETIVTAPSNTELEIIDTDSKEWFEIEAKTGNLIIKKDIDREHYKLKNMLKSQVKTKIRAIENKSSKKSFNASFGRLYQMAKNPACIDISSIPHERNILEVVVTIEDKNDETPKFVEESPLIIGYPNSVLTEFIAPPYLVKVTATDDDIGINAKIRYSVDGNLKIDSENGIIYPGEDLSSDTEFTVTATDKDGAKDGNKHTLKLKVKILEDKHIVIVTLKNMAYSEVDDFIASLSQKTDTEVKYLTSTALPNTDAAEEKTNLRQTRADDKLPVLRIVMYALENENVVEAAEFQKLIEDSDIAESFEVKSYVNPSVSDDSGWIAAVSTLSVLLGLVIIAVVAGYIFYLRPRLLGKSIKYEKHINRDSVHSTPVENKYETKISDRRPTGFPIGFTPKDIDDDDYEELESVKDEKIVEVDDVFEESEITSKPEPERRKSVVQFDTNVTEIEISEL